MSCVCFNCGHHASCQAILGWEIELLFGLREADKPNRLHSVNAALPAALTGPRFLSGRGDEVRDTLIKAKELAAFFDASPSHDESGIRFVGRIEYTSAHDDRGPTAMDGVCKATSRSENEELTALWKSVTEQEGLHA